MLLTDDQQKRIKPFAFHLRYKWLCSALSDTVNALMDSQELRKSLKCHREHKLAVVRATTAEWLCWVRRKQF